MSLQLILQLVIIALAVGSLPLIYSAIKGTLLNFNQLVWLVLFCTFDLVIFGAFTRLTDSGLGCPDWPGCYGHSNPIFAIDLIKQAQDQMPFGPVTESKAWIEMIHRYFASAVGFLIVVLCIISWLKRHTFGIRVFMGALLLLFLVCLQGGFGALTVTMKLQPIIVTTHLLLAILLILGLTIMTDITTQKSMQMRNYSTVSSWLPLIAAFLCLTQIFLGGWVSTNYAVLACTGFPLCNGEILPTMDFETGFHFWRELGKTGSGESITSTALVAIHWFHRLGALIVFIFCGSLYLLIEQQKTKGNTLWQKNIKLWNRNFIAVLTLQLITGISNVVFNWPIVAALAHTAGAAALLICLSKLTYLARVKQ